MRKFARKMHRGKAHGESPAKEVQARYPSEGAHGKNHAKERTGIVARLRAHKNLCSKTHGKNLCKRTHGKNPCGRVHAKNPKKHCKESHGRSSRGWAHGHLRCERLHGKTRPQEEQKKIPPQKAHGKTTC